MMDSFQTQPQPDVNFKRMPVRGIHSTDAFNLEPVLIHPSGLYSGAEPLDQEIVLL